MVKNCCQKKEKSFSIDDIIEFLKIISVKNRACIICRLQQEEQCVCCLEDQLELPQNLISHHLKVLSEAGIVESRKEGLNVFYSLNKKRMKKYKEVINKFL